jgi:hypothetical protein
MRLKLGNAWQTELYLHWTWLALMPLLVWVVVSAEWVPLPAAIITVFSWLGSVIMHELARLYAARRSQSAPPSVTLFLFGGVVHPSRRANAKSDLHSALSGAGISLILAAVFGLLWWLETGVLGIEMELIALFNAALFLFSLLIQTSKYQPNALHALLRLTLPTARQQWASRVMTVLRESAVVLFAMSAIFVLELGPAPIIALWVVVLLSFTQAAALTQRLATEPATLPPLVEKQTSSNGSFVGKETA